MAMLIVGLTGSIGMGKSTVAGWFADHGFAIGDSDAIVHALYANGGAAVGPVAALVPDALNGGAIDRAALSAALNAMPDLFKRLEGIVHPLVRAAQNEILVRAFAAGAKVAVLDIPLLFETAADARVDAVVVAHATDDVQRDRVLARPGMTAETFEQIKARQMPSAEKARHADFVIDTSVALGATKASVDALADALAQRGGSAYRRHWADA